MTDNEVLELMKDRSSIMLWDVPTAQMIEVIGIQLESSAMHGLLISKNSYKYRTKFFEAEEPKPKSEMVGVLDTLTHELAVSRQPNNYRNGHTAGLMLAVKVVKDLINKEKSK